MRVERALVGVKRCRIGQDVLRNSAAGSCASRQGGKRRVDFLMDSRSDLNAQELREFAGLIRG